MNTTVKRTIYGVLFLLVMLAGMLWNRYGFLALFLAMDAGMLLEFYKMTLGSSHKTVQAGALVTALAAFLLVALVSGPQHLAPRFLCLVPVLLLVLMIIMVFRHTGFKDFSYVFAGLLYIGLPLALSPMLITRPDGSFTGLLMLAFFIIIWSGDVGAYCFGMLLGQRSWSKKLCPGISPKKSWAGAIGGMVSALLAGAVLYWTHLLACPLVHCLVLAAVMNVTSVFGDLFESLWKRQFGLKDSGNVIPGHGGLLDRFDSALFAIPAGAAYLVLFGLL